MTKHFSDLNDFSYGIAESIVKVGDIYESCGYHPVLCTEADEWDVMGISLIDGSHGHYCSINHCGVRKLSVKEALERKEHWVEDRDKRLESEYWQELYKRDGIT